MFSSISSGPEQKRLDPQDIYPGFDENDPEIQKRLDKIYWKLDMRIIPALWILYFMEMFGGAAYGVSLTMNMSEEHSLIQKLGLTSRHLSIATAMSYVGTIVFDVPMNLIMTRVPAQRWLSRILVSVGLIYTCYIALRNAGGLIALRLLEGIAGAGVWPGMAYYISLWYPHHRTARRIGYYFSAAQISAAVSGLVSAGFQHLDGNAGYTGYQWMYLTYGCFAMAVGISMNWWLPDRPYAVQKHATSKVGRFFERWMPEASYPLNEDDRKLHLADMATRYSVVQWDFKNLLAVFLDPRIWPLIMMYFGVVGTGIGLENFASLIINKINPDFSSIDLSLLVAPIWLFDFAGIVTITPFADKFKRYRTLIFSLSTCIIITGLFVTTYAKPAWSRWGGLLLCGFGLGSTVPICMTLAAEIFGPRHGDVGIGAASALVSGLGNLGSVATTYALYTGWPADEANGFRKSNMVMVAILGVSIISAGCCVLLRYYLGDFKPGAQNERRDILEEPTRVSSEQSDRKLEAVKTQTLEH